MQLSEVYRGLGEENFGKLVRGISIGKLKTYQIYEGFKVRAHLHKVNTEILRKSTPRFWARIMEGDDDFGKDLGQCVLVSHLDMIAAALDFLGIPHENGFFAKDIDAKTYFSDGWEERLYERLKPNFPEALLVFYINHLRLEVLGSEEIFLPQAAPPSAAA